MFVLRLKTNKQKETNNKRQTKNKNKHFWCKNGLNFSLHNYERSILSLINHKKINKIKIKINEDRKNETEYK